MREIRFRCWDIKNKLMIGHDTLTGHAFEKNGWPYICNLLNSPEILKDEYTLMQFTGLLDKHGKEIFEGDIFRVEDGDDIFYVVIVWVKEWCMFCTLMVDEYNAYVVLKGGIEALDEPSFWTYTLQDTDDTKYFLCGNIHETPELL